MPAEFLGSHPKRSIDDEGVLMNVKDVAKFLKVETAMGYACNKGEIPFLKVGKLYKFKKADVLKWLDKDKDNKLIDVDEYVNKYLQKNILKG